MLRYNKRSDVTEVLTAYTRIVQEKERTKPAPEKKYY